jgi:hypothetical protein
LDGIGVAAGRRNVQSASVRNGDNAALSRALADRQACPEEVSDLSPTTEIARCLLMPQVRQAPAVPDGPCDHAPSEAYSIRRGGSMSKLPAGRVYISYAWGGESERVAGLLDAALARSGIEVVRDKHDVGYKGRIAQFMREIGRGQAVVLIISDKYLKSPNCMFELVEVARNKAVAERIFPVVLADADISDPVARIAYIQYWEAKVAELNAAMRTVSAANLHGLREEIDSYSGIRDHIAGLTSLLKDMNTLTPQMHEDGNFSALIAALLSHQPGEATAVAAEPAMAATGEIEAYIAQVTSSLVNDEWKLVQGQMIGGRLVKHVFEKTDGKYILSPKHYFVVLIERAACTAEDIGALDRELQHYAELKHFNVLLGSTFVLGVIMTGHLDAKARETVMDAHAPVPDDLIGGRAAHSLAVYAALDRNFAHQRFMPIGTDFEAIITSHLL